MIVAILVTIGILSILGSILFVAVCLIPEIEAGIKRIKDLFK